MKESVDVRDLAGFLKFLRASGQFSLEEMAAITGLRRTQIYGYEELSRYLDVDSMRAAVLKASEAVAKKASTHH